jgi:tetratricopeptide (TPR) repeat protein
MGDNLFHNEVFSKITSGSSGEGLDMKGSDLDIMFVFKDVNVYEDINSTRLKWAETCVAMEMDDTKLGFSRLRLLHCNNNFILGMCKQVGNDLYLSSQLCTSMFLGKYKGSDIVHGPCLSDKDGYVDMALALQSRQWISIANQWITRYNCSWPRSDVKSHIIEHGVLFVPIGSKGSKNEHIEWRISFSVSEKILIYSFTQTQLLCYALMKILIKDVVNRDSRCKDLICSFYIKNIIFWISEETSLSIWRPENLISCFMSCLRRLIYCLEYGICLHFFIPKINMFENKIEEQERQLLLGHLNALWSYGWRSVLLSEQLYTFPVLQHHIYSNAEVHVEYIKRILCVLAVINTTGFHLNSYHEAVHFIRQSRRFKSFYRYFMSMLCQTVVQCKYVVSVNRNKDKYKQYRRRLCYLTQNIHHDAVSGWLMLASLYYQMKQYNMALYITSYALSKCTPEKVYNQENVTDWQYELIKTRTVQSLGITIILKLLRVSFVLFTSQSTLIPEELELEVVNSLHIVPPVVYSHFLQFLCHFHLNNVNHCYYSLRDLQLTISEDYFILGTMDRSNSYNCLGVAYQLIGKRALAERAFRQAIKIDPTNNCASQRLQMTTLVHHNHIN